MNDRKGPHVGKGPRGPTPDNLRLREAVCERLAEDPLLDARGVEVSADGGVVTLQGAVPGASDMAHAGMIVGSTAGVRDVRNLLSHDPGLRRNDGVEAPAPDRPDHWSTGFVG